MRKATITLAAIGGAAALFSGCGSSSKSPTTSNPSVRPAAATSGTSLTNTASAGLILAASHYGNVLFDSNRRALYLFAADSGPTSTCYGACAKAWPPLLTQGTPTAGAGLTPSLLGVTRRTDGSTQVTYAGHPLYYFSGDHGSGIACQGADSQGGFWYVVNADGSANKAHGEMMMHHTMHHHSMHHEQGSSTTGA
jgi:predicted lipoprotein with Yx(FWY)xxD motif